MNFILTEDNITIIILILIVIIIVVSILLWYYRSIKKQYIQYAKENITSISKEDTEKTKRTAQDTLQQALSKFKDGKWDFSNGYLNVKIPMKDKVDGVVEYIWVSAESINNNTISGKINVYPVIIKAEYGDDASFEIGEICDWRIIK